MKETQIVFTCLFLITQPSQPRVRLLYTQYGPFVSLCLVWNISEDSANPLSCIRVSFIDQHHCLRVSFIDQQHCLRVSFIDLSFSRYKQHFLRVSFVDSAKPLSCINNTVEGSLLDLLWSQYFQSRDSRGWVCVCVCVYVCMCVCVYVCMCVSYCKHVTHHKQRQKDPYCSRFLCLWVSFMGLFFSIWVFLTCFW